MPIKMTALGGLPPAYSWQDPSLHVVDFVSYWTRTAASNALNVFVIRSPKDIYACIVSFKSVITSRRFADGQHRLPRNVSPDIHVKRQDRPGGHPSGNPR